MTETENRIRNLVLELDSLIPTENAAIRIDVYGGGIDESYLRGTRQGLQRLGTQLLKAAHAPFTDTESRYAPGIKNVST